MALNLIFDQSAQLYDRVRPRYVQALFDDVAAYANLGAGLRALEVGAGTGQATGAMLAYGVRIDALEPGAAMAGLLRAKYADRPNLRVREALFEDVSGEAEYDLVYSATAFHWIPEEIGYPKALRLLKPGGAIALFWNHPFPGRPGDGVCEAVRAVYRKYEPGPDPKVYDAESALPARRALLARYGLSDVDARVYRGERRLSARDYISLMNTYSNHLALPDGEKAALEADMARAIDDNGGILTIYDAIDLYLGRKPLGES